MSSLLVVVNDIHANSTVAICPPAVQLDDGGTYRASKAQKWLWSHWIKFCADVEDRRKGKKLYLVLAGDLVDGDHHDTPQIISRNIETQSRIALAVLQPLLDTSPDEIYVVRGTEAHVGKSAQWEEFIARDIGAIPEPNTGASSWWSLPLDVEGVRFDIAHHGPIGRLPWTVGNALNKLAAVLWMQYTQAGLTPPHVAFRAHNHVPGDSGMYTPVRVISNPSWQLSTAYGQRLSPGKLLPIGGHMVECTGGAYNIIPHIVNPPLQKYVKAGNANNRK